MGDTDIMATVVVSDAWHGIVWFSVSVNILASC